MTKTAIRMLTASVAICALAACSQQAAEDAAPAEAATEVRGAFDNDGFESDYPVGTWESVRDDGSTVYTRHDTDFMTRDPETGEVIGEWTQQGALTCMVRTAAPNLLTCFVVSADENAECPELIGPPEGIEQVNCIVASPLQEDGSRRLKTPDGNDRVVRRIES